jgi:hypothetical protein
LSEADFYKKKHLLKELSLEPFLVWQNDALPFKQNFHK